MVARTMSFVTVGVDARLVTVEADVGAGLPGIKIVGLADTAISEARDRVRAAASHSDVEWPRTRITIALLPAGLPKRGAVLDAAIAVAILAASDQVPAGAAAGTVIAGELGLDGTIHATRGVIAAALTARRQGIARMLVPEANVAEARLVPGIDVGGVSTLAHLIAVLRGDRTPGDGDLAPLADDPGAAPDLADVHGQDEARRALEIARARGMRPLVARCLAELALSCTASGDATAAAQHADEARRLMIELGLATPDSPARAAG